MGSAPIYISAWVPSDATCSFLLNLLFYRQYHTPVRMTANTTLKLYAQTLSARKTNRSAESPQSIITGPWFTGRLVISP